MSIDVAFLYCTLVPGMMSMVLILYEILPFVYFMRPLTFTCEIRSLLSRSLALLLLDVKVKVVECLYNKMKFVCSEKFEIWAYVWRQL